MLLLSRAGGSYSFTYQSIRRSKRFNLVYLEGGYARTEASPYINAGHTRSAKADLSDWSYVYFLAAFKRLMTPVTKGLINDSGTPVGIGPFRKSSRAGMARGSPSAPKA